MANKNVIIVGCPRGATGYASKFFTHNGVDMGHESFGVNGISSWCIVPGGNHSLWGPSFNEVIAKYGKDTPIFHQTNHPIETISSLMTITKHSMDYAARFTNISESNTKLKNCMLFWLEWNTLAEKLTAKRYKVSDIAKQWDGLDKVYPDTKYNDRPCRQYTEKELLYEDTVLWLNIIKKAREYGWDVGKKTDKIFKDVDNL